jgi:probable rRNA maturation factor
LRARRLAVTVRNASGERTVPAAAEIRRWVRRAIDGRAGGEVNVRVVTDQESAELNSRYRGARSPTNVLAFPANLPEREDPARADPEREDELLPLGDLVIAAAVVAREAAEQGKPLEAHWAHIVIHGALHLVGYDHVTESEAEIMEQRERELLAEIGIPDPYRAGV